MSEPTYSLPQKVRFITKKVQSLPTLPTVYSNLCRVIKNPLATIPDVVDVISSDKSTVSRILKLVNSAAFGLDKRVETISQAVVLVGIEEVRNLVMASSVMKYFSNNPPQDLIHPEAFWEHSIGVGLATRLLGREIGLTDIESLYTAGLLHDVGKLFFMANVPEDYAHVLEHAHKQRQPIRSAELDILGIDHAEAGFHLAVHWNLPEYLQLAMRSHHRTITVSSTTMHVALVQIANYWVRALSLGDPGDRMVVHPRRGIWQGLPLKPASFERLTPILVREHRQLVRRMLAP